MNIIQISDLHFGPRHWVGNTQVLLDKINSYKADIVINTGDCTSDGLENEYSDAGAFLKSIKCKHVISTMGNHDKRNMRSHELFRKYIYTPELITIPDTTRTSKKHLFLDREITKVDDYFTDINFIKSINVEGKILLVISIDSNELYNDDGYVEKEVLKAVSAEIKERKYDIPLLMTHYSVLGTDECPLTNSAALIDFVQLHNIKHVLCGHTHELEIMYTNDLYQGYSFTQYMCGSLSSRNLPNDDNMFLYYENFGSDNMHVHLVRVFPEDDKIVFKEEFVY
ncbi:MAG: metallophosphoesterase [Spirochaetaceae bacterium]|nr:metallophosphoesterase [Spirochaetaceae bacterium]